MHRGCPHCGGPVPGVPASDDHDHRNFHVVSKRVVFGASPMVGDDFTDVVVASIPAAAAVDVFIKYREESDASAVNPFGEEVWKVFAVQNEIRSQVGPGRASTEAGKGFDGIPAGRILAVRDVPAESFDITLSSVGMGQGDTVYFDLVIISWGSEPTGIGPMALSTVFDGQNDGSPVAQKAGLIPMVRNGSGWAALRGNHAGALKVTVAGYGGSEGVLHSHSSNWQSSFAGGSSPSRLVGLSVSSKAAAAGWIFIFDAATVPANGTPPEYPPVPIPAGNVTGAFVSLDFAAMGGRAMATGVVAAFSSTPDVLTLGSADCWFEIEHLWNYAGEW